MKTYKTYFYKIYGSRRIVYTEILILRRYTNIPDANEIYTYKELINILNHKKVDVHNPGYTTQDSISFLCTDDKIYVSPYQFKISIT